MLGGARARLARTPELADRLSFVLGEARRCRSPTASSTRCTFTYLLRYVDDRAATMRELARVVKPGGRIGMVEFGVPAIPRLRALWRIHTRVGLPLHRPRGVAGSGTRSVGSWARTSSSSTPPSPICRALWREPGSATCRAAAT